MLEILRFEWEVDGDASVVDQDVDFAVRGHCGVDEGLWARCGGEVGFDGEARIREAVDNGAGAFSFGRVRVVDYYDCTKGRQFTSNLRAYAGVGAADDGNLALERVIHNGKYMTPEFERWR